MKPTPPYPPYTLFLRFVKDLAAIGIPRKIHTSSFGELSDSARSSLVGALRYLNLIGNDGVPTAQLAEFVQAHGSARPNVWSPIVRTGYAFVFNDKFDLSKATAEALAERFRNEHVSGGTLKKAVAFFIALTIDAGIPISPSLMRRKHAASGRPVRRQRSAAPHERESGNTEPVPEAAPSDPPAMKEKSLADILNDLLDAKLMTEKEQQAVLTLLLYLKRRAASASVTV